MKRLFCFCYFPIWILNFQYRLLKSLSHFSPLLCDVNLVVIKRESKKKKKRESIDGWVCFSFSILFLVDLFILAPVSLTVV